jgi:hypothetical protein
MKNRRDFLRNTLGLGAGLAAAPRLFAAPHESGTGMDMKHISRAAGRSGEIVSVETPDVPQLPWRMDADVKEFHLIAEPVKQEIVPGRVIDLWGYNGNAPGPTIQVNQGDRVRIIVDNHLPEATSMHWHGFEVPVEMDGSPGSSQDPIPPGGRFVYEFTLHQEGTYFYHSHMAMQEMMGMIGAFIMHPRETYKPRADKDFAIILQEYAILPNITVPNSMNMSKSGKEATIGVLNEGDFFGEGCLTGQPFRMCSASAMTDCTVMRIEKKSMVDVIHREHVFSDMFVTYLLTRNIRYEEDLVDQLFNSSEKRLARILLLLAHFGKDGKPEVAIPTIS